jgi:hypothetical protein
MHAGRPTAQRIGWHASDAGSYRFGKVSVQVGEGLSEPFRMAAGNPGGALRCRVQSGVTPAQDLH